MKQLNNKVLIIILAALVIAFVVTKTFRSPGRQTNLDAGILKIDTARVTTIALHASHDKPQEVKLLREEKVWKVSSNDVTANVDRHALNNLLKSIASLRPERVVSRKKEKWNNYGVGDSAAVELIAYDNQNTLAHLWIGKESQGATYVRQGDDNEIYAVPGALRATIGKSFDDWRDKSFLRLEKDQITKIELQYPADSGFVIERKDKIWNIGNAKADSIKMENYLNTLRSRDLTAFADEFSPATGPDFTLTVFKGTIPMATIKAWRKSAQQWIMTSTHQQDVYFTESDMATLSKLFPAKQGLLPDLTR